MDNELLLKLLAERNRLVIPGFGAFLKKDSDGAAVIVFSPFLKKDDGVLAGAIAGELGLGDEDAKAIIEEYTSHIRTSLDKNGKFLLEGVGTLTTDENGAVSFVADGAAKIAAEPANVAESAPQAAEPVEKTAVESRIPTPPAQAEQAASPKAQPFVSPGMQQGAVPRPQPRGPIGAFPGAGDRPAPRPVGAAPRPQQPIAPRPAPQPRPLGRPVVPGQQSQSRPAQGQRPASGHPYPEGAQAPQGQRPAGPQGRQTVPGRPGQQGRRPMPPKNRRAPGRPGSKGKTDTWLIAAIIAAVIAIILIIYGLAVTSPSMEIDIEDIQPPVTDTLSMLTGRF